MGFRTRGDIRPTGVWADHTPYKSGLSAIDPEQAEAVAVAVAVAVGQDFAGADTNFRRWPATTQVLPVNRSFFRLSLPKLI